jgi:7,8-dihydropterin-6-yl-methyl-4-(beta-D-ribofuranosyl)aminobenzene 5'-phosphate synthase
MEIAIAYDNSSLEGFRSGWGFSCLVNQKVLFDTGEDPEPLLYNLDRMGFDMDAIEAVVISHDHWDHTGGLWEVLRRRQGITVYACPGFSGEFKAEVERLGGKLIEADSPLDIDRSISVTGEIPGEFRGTSMPEQALTIKTESGVVVVTGCSHPGIVTIVERVKAIFPERRLTAVLGGFHLMDSDRKTIESIVKTLEDLGVEKVGATHCTGDQAQMLFRKSFGDRFIPVTAGKTIELA